MTPPPPGKNLYHFAGYYRAEPKLAWSIFTFYEGPKMMTDAEAAAAFAPAAKAAFAAKGHPEAEPVFVRADHHYDLPSPPRLPADDHRPLKAWDIWIDFVVDDVKFGSTINETFFWPEEPKGAVLNQLVFFYLSCDIAGRGDHPGYANEARVNGQRVTPSTKTPPAS